MLAGLLHNRFVELVVCDRETPPLNPFNGAMVIVDCPPVPVVTETLAGLTVIAKSWT